MATPTPSILIVEDEFFLADDLKRALMEHHVGIVGPASTVAHARLLLADHPVDLAVLDINLKGQPIFPLADELRHGGIPFVFLTGYDTAMIPAEYQDVERWEKPAEMAQLARRLAGL